MAANALVLNPANMVFPLSGDQQETYEIYTSDTVFGRLRRDIQYLRLHPNSVIQLRDQMLKAGGIGALFGATLTYFAMRYIKPEEKTSTSEPSTLRITAYGAAIGGGIGSLVGATYNVSEMERSREYTTWRDQAIRDKIFPLFQQFLEKSDVIENFLCPITQDLISIPVRDPKGRVYERDAIFAWIDRWLSQRKTREILGALFMIAILSLQLLNPALHQHRRTSVTEGQQGMEQARKVQAEILPWLNTIYEVQKWFPPGLAADAIGKAAQNEPLPALGSLAILGLFVVAAGTVLGTRLKAEYRGENLGQAPGRTKTSRTAAIAGEPAMRPRNGIVGGSSPIAAVIEKEVRALLRTLPLLYAIGSPLLLVLIFSTAFMRGNGPAMIVFPLALPVCMIYAQLGFTQVFYNNLGAEGAGIQLYFLSPTPIRTVMLAKNIFHATLFACVALIAATLTCLRLGIPGGGVILATIGWLLFSLPLNLAIGDIFSVRMAYRLNPGRIARQRGSQSNSLLSLLVQLAAFSVGAGVFWLGYFLGRQWISALIFVPLSAIAFMVWFRVLGSIDAWANGRKDLLVATLMKTE